MIQNGHKINERDKCMYIKSMLVGYVLICLYVDNLLIFENNDGFIKIIKNVVKKNFEIKDLGVMNVILGINILRNLNGLGLTQFHYVQEVIESFK